MPDLRVVLAVLTGVGVFALVAKMIEISAASILFGAPITWFTFALVTFELFIAWPERKRQARERERNDWLSGWK